MLINEVNASKGEKKSCFYASRSSYMLLFPIYHLLFFFKIQPQFSLPLLISKPSSSWCQWFVIESHQPSGSNTVVVAGKPITPYSLTIYKDLHWIQTAFLGQQQIRSESFQLGLMEQQYFHLGRAAFYILLSVTQGHFALKINIFRSFT